MLREHAFDSGSLFDEELNADESGWREQASKDYWRQQFIRSARKILRGFSKSGAMSMCSKKNPRHAAACPSL
jgi:ATP-dependent exoDNAse (exonuclease V) beta subunit